MPRPHPAIDLTDAEKRDLIGLIQAGKALPEKYRFLLLEDKREVNLVWSGKTRDVCITVLPFQTLAHVGRLFVEEAITGCRKRGASRVDLLAFEFEMGLFPGVLDEARGKGIELAPKQIPPEVFDKRAVDRYQVAVKVIDIFGNDTMTIVPVQLG